MLRFLDLCPATENEMPDAIDMKRACIDACLDCYRICIQMASGHCVEIGSKHTEPGHFRLASSEPAGGS